MNNENSYLTLRDLWEQFVGNIWLFIASVVVCVSVAFGYIATTAPTYMRTISILVKSDKKNQTGVEAYFQEMGVVQPQTDLGNEEHVLKTPMLMEMVVKRLNLNYNYSVKYNNLLWVDIYRATPFRVQLDESLQQGTMSFHFTTDGNNKFHLSEVVVNEVELDPIDGEYDKEIKVGESQFTIVRSGVVSGPIKNNLYSFSKSSSLSTARALAGALSIERRSKVATILDISITLVSIQKADDLLNTLIECYNESWVKDRNEVTLSTTQFINDRLEIIERELGSVDKNITDYKSENLLPDVGAVASFNLQSSNDNFRLQVELNNQLSMAQYILEYIQNEITSEQLLPVNLGIDAATINDQISAYNEILIRKNMLLANSSATNPIVADMISDLSYIKRSLILSVEEQINTLNLKIASATSQQQAAQQRLSNNPSQELYLMSTGREQKIKEELYLYLLQKREENQLNQAFTAYNTKVLSYAAGSSAPVAPQKNVILLFGFAIGMILPILYIILSSALDTVIRTKRDLEGVNIPLVGAIPMSGGADSDTSILGRLKRLFVHKGKKDESSKDQAVVNSGRDIASEAFSVLRTNLDFMIDKSDDGAHIIQLISLLPGSGKTYISANLAMSMALKDAKVLVIDCDIRKATLSKRAGSPKVGLSSLLSGKIDSIDDIIIHNSLGPNLDIIPVGVVPPNPSELLLKSRFEQMITHLRSRYDYIFIDCPPVEIVPDAAIIGKYCDMSIFVIFSGRLDKRVLPDIELLAKSGKYKRMTLLINAVKRGGRGYYGYGKYGYGKYGYGSYGYGYGSYGEKPDKK
ncbi:MAG: polysaccharide biosynthesis tyrosine autokinase [Rikenellaceae bacterium]